MYKPHIQLLAICLLYLSLPADAFTFISRFSRYDGRRAQCKYSPVKTQLQAAVSPASVKPKKEEKFTKEAQELMTALDAKKACEPDAPLLIVAQVAPAVR